ncbi:hypothetical protein F183_A46210 [Bryobacterales bacterium F-183]|nr:hypothetical protein F183_A46210 [Bryobacterales bacterium F-183]
MSEALRTYLDDHHAGATFAVELLDSLRSQKADPELASFANVLQREIRADVEVLQSIIAQLGEAESSLKKALGHLAEKAMRAKFDPENARGIGTFEALETLSLGILGKRALWRVLRQIAEAPKLDYDTLIVRAEYQFQQVERFRLKVAQTTFSGAS